MKSISLNIIIFLCILCFSNLIILGMLHTFQAPLGGQYINELEQLRDAIWHYLLFRDENILIGHERLTMLEERHLLDVKHLLQVLFHVAGVLSFILIIGLYILRKRWSCIFKKVGLFGCLFTVSILLLTMVLGFRTAFIWFHSMLFIENTWWFDSNSSLIQVFPLVYFQQFIVIFCLISFLGFALIYCLAKLLGLSGMWGPSKIG